MDEHESMIVGKARAALVAGAKRDDVYHELVRQAARFGFNRYQLWNQVQEVVQEGR